MAISINWPTGVISIPQSYLTALGGGVYRLDINQLRLDIAALQDDEDGVAWPDVFNHNTEVTLSGVTYSRIVQFLAPYTFDFEDTGLPYTVTCVGANHNLADRKVVDNVSLIVGNSAGLISVATSGYAPEDVAIAVWNHSSAVQLATRLAESWARLGLDASRPVVQGQTSITFGDIALALTEAGGAVTVARQ